eukprot:1856263-Pyramimonas_sp.AAC.1
MRRPPLPEGDDQSSRESLRWPPGSRGGLQSSSRAPRAVTFSVGSRRSFFFALKYCFNAAAAQNAPPYLDARHAPAQCSVILGDTEGKSRGRHNKGPFASGRRYCRSYA